MRRWERNYSHPSCSSHATWGRSQESSSHWKQCLPEIGSLPHAQSWACLLQHCTLMSTQTRRWGAGRWRSGTCRTGVKWWNGIECLGGERGFRKVEYLRELKMVFWMSLVMSQILSRNWNSWYCSVWRSFHSLSNLTSAISPRTGDLVVISKSFLRSREPSSTILRT